jgi:hypothetical protein
MRVVFRVCIQALAIAALVCAAGWPTKAQAQQDHVVSLDQLNKDAARPAETRQSNEEAIRSLLSSDAGQKALKSAKVDYQRVDKAIGQLSDEDVTRFAERSRQIERDFAGGRNMSDRDLLIVIVIVVLVLIIVIVATR